MGQSLFKVRDVLILMFFFLISSLSFVVFAIFPESMFHFKDFGFQQETAELIKFKIHLIRFAALQPTHPYRKTLGRFFELLMKILMIVEI